MWLVRQFRTGAVIAILSGVALAAPLPIAHARSAPASTSSAGATPALAQAPASGPPGNITTWSVQTNTPDWNTNLGVTATRQGCSSSPTDCINLVRKVSQAANNIRGTLAIPLDTTSTTSNALQFSQLSLSAPFLVEVGIDDFVRQYKALFPNSNPSPQAAALVSTVIANLKSANPSLKFGTTIYEDELSSEYLQDARLPPATRAQFDTVHLFIHYREDGPNFAQSVQQAKQLFPNASIIAGSYAVDRRVAVDHSGNVYVVDAGNWVVRKIDTHGVMDAFAGDNTGDNKCGGGAPTHVRLDTPQGVAVDGSGNVEIADATCAMVFEVDVAGKTLKSVAGGPEASLTGDGGPATSTQLVLPVGVAVDSAGTIYIADSGANTIRTVDHSGIIHTLAGNGNADYTGDGGPAKAAALSSPEGVAVDRAGNVYIADFGNNVVRQVDTAGTIHTFAGTGAAGYAGDEGPATAAQLLAPQGVAVDSYGGVYIADTGNNVIRNVDASHTIHTFAGNGAGGFSGDGGPAASGELAQPAGLAEYDAYPHSLVGSIVVYVADTVKNRVRGISTPPVNVAP